jgi:hypothetical protein
MAALCALTLAIYAVRVARRETSSTAHFATEQRITANPAEAPVTAAVVSPDGKYVVYADTIRTLRRASRAHNILSLEYMCAISV